MEVVAIACNDIQRSPHYPAGLALRFARVTGYREDKSAAEIDTIDTVRGCTAATPGRSPAQGAPGHPRPLQKPRGGRRLGWTSRPEDRSCVACA